MSSAALAIPNDVPGLTFDQLYRSGVQRVWRVVSRLGVASSELEDAVQDVFIVAHRKFSTLRADVPPELWLTGIAAKVAHDYRRRVQRKPTEPLAPAVKVADAATAPDEIAVQRDALAFAMKILDALEPEQREVFVLAEFEQLTAPQIATATGAPVNTVYSRLRLARGRFNQLLQERAP